MHGSLIQFDFYATSGDLLTLRGKQTAENPRLLQGARRPRRVPME